MVKHGLVLIIFISSLSLVFAQQKAFVLGGNSTAPGQKHSFSISVVSPGGDSTFIPVTVIHGKEKGPVLGLIAGIHGYEYPPIMALQRLSKEIDATLVKGTIILVHIANVKAFLGRSVYYNPVDGKNLNRVFPGNKNGTLSECIAWTLSNTVLSQCNYLVDIHAGDASEDLHPYAAYYTNGSQAVKARQMAEALNFPWIIISEASFTAGQPTRYCTQEAVSRNIATVAIEYGKLGQVRPEEAQYINDGLLNMMRSLHIIPGSPLPTSVPVEIRKRTSITSEHTGIFYSTFKSGALVRKGATLGTITDLFGNTVQEIISPVNGFIIYMMATPPVNKGETLFSLAQEDY